MKFKLQHVELVMKKGAYTGNSEKEIAEKIGNDIAKIISKGKAKINFIMVDQEGELSFESHKMYQLGKKTKTGVKVKKKSLKKPKQPKGQY